MFWGLNLKPNRKYSQTTTKNFHISQAALEDGENSKVYITSGNQKFLICTLENDGSSKQVFLDLNFAEGEEVCFQTVGSGNVTLSGYVIENCVSEDEEDDDISREDLIKQLKKAAKRSSKLQDGEDEDVEDSTDDEENEGEDDSDDDDQELEEDDEDDEEDDDEEGEEDDEEDDEEEEEEEEVQQPKAKQIKLDKPNKNEKQAHAKQNGTVKKGAEVIADKKSKKDKKADKKGGEQNSPQQQATGGSRVITGGVKIDDTRVGNGPEAKNGKRASVYYEGRLKTNNQVFDSLKQGKPFSFLIGRGEVIKGWEVGIVGMKVGGKRRITCPPHMAYGSRGSPPSIPANSTLIFDVVLKGVN